MTKPKKTVIHLSWATALRAGVRAVSLAKTAVLARILTPVQFGTFGIATMVLSLLEILTETGINVFLLQQKKKFSDFIDTAWVVSIFRGMIVAAVIFAISPLVARFFNSPDSLPLLYLTSLVPLIRGFINPTCVIFQKQLQFEREFVYRMIITAVEAAAAVILSLHYTGPAALVWSLIISAAFETALSWIVFKPRPKFAFVDTKLKAVLSSGIWVTGFGVFDYVFTNLDNIVVAKLLGPSALGIYQNAYKLSTAPLSEVNDIFYKVMFPTYVKILHDKKRVTFLLLWHSVAVGIAAILLGLGVYAFAPQLVAILLGPAWSEAVPAVRVLAFLGMIRAISFAFNSLFMAQGKQKYVTIMIGVGMFALAVTIVPFVMWFGLVGAGYSAVISALVSLPIAVFFILRSLRTI